MTRRAGSAADDAEAGPPQDVGWKTEIYDIQNIEKLSAKLQRQSIASSTPADRRVF